MMMDDHSWKYFVVVIGLVLQCHDSNAFTTTTISSRLPPHPPMLLEQPYRQRRKRQRSLLHSSSSFLPGDSSSGSSRGLTESTSNIDNQKVERVLSSFCDWYSTPPPLDSGAKIRRQANGTSPLLVSILAPDVTWDDCHYMYQPLSGIDAVERHLRLQRIHLLSTWNAPIRMVLDDVVLMPNHSSDNDHNSDTTTSLTVGFVFHHAERTNGSAEGMALQHHRGIVVLDLKRSPDTGYRIVTANTIREKSIQTGEFSLRILSLASKFLTQSTPPFDTSTPDKVAVDESTATLPELYFDAWNRRDMIGAVSLFTDDISYDDTAFPQAFVGKEKLQEHLLKCASCFPATFTFCVDRVVVPTHDDASNMIVAWHVDNANEPLPFTNGLSYYEINPTTRTISKGIDFVDSESIKIATIFDPVLSLYQYEPIRLVPTAAWIAYMYVVFISDGILPGANALQLETRTWEEVRDLSLNFFLVAPILNLPFSPSVHPMLEGVFNVLLSWAAMFAGFLSDDRRNKPNILPFLPIVIGMQFLTSAFLLPYVATRTPECYMTHDETSDVVWNDLDKVSTITENRSLGPTLAFVGFYSIVWAIFGRGDEFGGFTERYQSFIDLLSIDRVGSSFIVDLIIFALFQGWFIDDDMQRRGVDKSEMQELKWLGKIVPFFGMALYLALRPSYSNDSTSS